MVDCLLFSTLEERIINYTKICFALDVLLSLLDDFGVMKQATENGKNCDRKQFIKFHFSSMGSNNSRGTLRNPCKHHIFSIINYIACVNV